MNFVVIFRFDRIECWVYKYSILYSLLLKITPKIGSLVVGGQYHTTIGEIQLVEDQTDLPVDLSPDLFLFDNFHKTFEYSSFVNPLDESITKMKSTLAADRSQKG